MTTRNFRVHNGISVGDITISASANTITGLATAAPSSDGDVANKKYVDDQDALIASDTLTFTNKTFDANGTGNSISNIDFADFTSGVVLDEDNMASNSATNLATQQSIKAYVDAQVTASDLDFQADTGGALSIDLDSETMTFTGGTGIDTSGSGNAVTFAIDSTVATLTGSQTLTNKTLTTPVISSISNTGTLTLPTSTDTLVGRATTDTLTNKTLTSAVLNTGVSGTAVLDEDNMLSNSATKLATQQSIKAYVDDSLAGLSQNSISQLDSSITVTDSGSNGTITVNADNTTAMTITSDGVTIPGNLTVNGTETIINTQNLSVEDAIIALNSNVSQSSQMPRFSGLHLHRGTGSTVAEQDIYWLWDDAYADDGTSIYGNAGGAWTALRSTHAEGTETPNSDFELVDMRCNVVHALSTSAQYADVAERFEADAPMSAGAVVEVGGSAEITETTTDLSENVFGVISDMPAYAMNAAAGNNDTHPFVAMTGRTPVRVTGAVTKGQRLVSSSVKGCARAVAPGESISPFNVIGRALESNTDTGIKLVNCAVRTNN